MALFLITGLPGVGKSTVYAELKSRSYEAYDGDEDHLARWYDIESGAEVSFKDETTAPDFIYTHSRCIARHVVEDLADRARTSHIFLCGDPANEDELRDLFEKIFILIIDDDTIKHRLAIRTNNTWGKKPHEVEYSFRFRKEMYDNAKNYGYTELNAALTPVRIVDEIIAAIGADNAR